MYQERWQGGDPTAGIKKKWKTKKRKRVSKFDELSRLLQYLDRASEEMEVRDCALFGLMLFTGCRPSEARTAPLHAIAPYGEIGSWVKGKTKTGEDQEIPLPTQITTWIAAWKAIRPTRPSSYWFPGQDFNQPNTADWVGQRWHDLRLILGIRGCGTMISATRWPAI